MVADIVQQPLHDDESSGSSSVSTAAAGKQHTQPGDIALLNDHLYPDDSFTREGVYWADLPSSERRQWVNSENNKEAARELRVSRRAPRFPGLFQVFFRAAVRDWRSRKRRSLQFGVLIAQKVYPAASHKSADAKFATPVGHLGRHETRPGHSRQAIL